MHKQGSSSFVSARGRRWLFASLTALSLFISACGGADPTVAALPAEVASVEPAQASDSSPQALGQQIDQLAVDVGSQQAAAHKAVGDQAVANAVAAAVPPAEVPSGSAQQTDSAAATETPTSTATAVDAADSKKSILAVTSTTSLDPNTDPRVVSLLDGDKSAAAHTWHDFLQLSDWQSIDYLKELPSNGVRHWDGSLWFGRAWSGIDGKPLYTARLRQYQPTFGGNTARAEWMSPNVGWSNLPYVIDEKRGYWFAVEYRFADDIVNNTGQQYGGRSSLNIAEAHNITWGDLPRSSGEGFGGRVTGNQLIWRIHGPGSNPSYLYDVRTTPLSTTPVANLASGGSSGTSRQWIIATLQPGQSVKLVGRVKFANTKAGNPRTEIWRKIGSGSWVKIIDNWDANTYSTGVRYWKVGLYTWDLSSTWWGNRNTRTMDIRSDMWLRDEASSGRVALSSDLLMRWLDR